ncbi:MAG TPA: glycosyltransferase family 2 protein [Flavisolibacter sp.]|nr:glycosyltransferase family 2 protein [Flavisolibacter sp.]
MRLSVIIVNYNVRYFLEQCLHTVEKCSEGLEVETIVVDNQSTDGSLPYLEERFPWVSFIANSANLGFARACNAGLAISKGELVLFLNPDTLLPEDCFRKCLDFFDRHPGCGALGVQMIDGSGKFLRESKRSFPSPLTSLFKLFGLSAIFPRSSLFGRYHLGHLSKEEDHEVDVLAGAFMMVRKEVLLETGGFDETFFMYGEDVDLSFRIQKAGYSNHYFAGTTIIHFKGESTKRGSLNYVRMFYNAMSVFVRKHYGGARAGLFSASIHFAIWVRAALAALSKFFRWVGLPVIDALLMLFSLWAVKELWVRYVKTEIVYSTGLLFFSFPVFTLLFLTVAYYAGMYDRYYKFTNLVRSTCIATLALLAVYALLPEQLRFSRGIIVFGALGSFVLISLVRMALVRTGVLQEPADKRTRPYILIAAAEAEYEKAKILLEEKGFGDKIIGRIGINGDGEQVVARLEGVERTAALLDAQEIIFCAGPLSYKRIIEEVQRLNGKMRVRFFGGSSIVGSDDQTTRGEILSSEVAYRLAWPVNRRLKRLIDVLAVLFLLPLFPLHVFLIGKPLGLIKNCFAVLAGKRTWIGYTTKPAGLPPLRKGVLGPGGVLSAHEGGIPAESLRLMDHWYARDYEWLQDLRILLKNYRYLGH